MKYKIKDDLSYSFFTTCDSKRGGEFKHIKFLVSVLGNAPGEVVEKKSACFYARNFTEACLNLGEFFEFDSDNVQKNMTDQLKSFFPNDAS